MRRMATIASIWQQSAGSVFDYMEEYLSDFLMNEFHDETLLRKKLAMLDEMIARAEGQTDCGEYWSAHYGYENNILKRLEIMRDLQYTEEDIRAYKEKNWRFAAVRMLQLSEYLEHVNELKVICTKDEWEKYREQILTSRSGWSIRYQLMEKEFPERVRDAYVQYVRKQAELVSDRKRYKELVQYLKKIRKYPEGDAVASEIAGEWKEKYRRRPAMMDELRRAKF